MVTVSSHEEPAYKRAKTGEIEQRLQLDQLGSAHSLRARVEQMRTSFETTRARERSIRDSFHEGGHPKVVVVPFGEDR